MNTYHEMQVLDAALEKKPTPTKVKQMAELRIRNLNCFKELQAFNDTGKWLYHHPLIIHESEQAQLEELRRRNPQEFLKQYAACNGNIKRYSSYMKNPAREARRAQDKANLKRNQERAAVFESIISEENETN